MQQRPRDEREGGLARPFDGLSMGELDAKVDEFITISGLNEHNKLFKRGIVLAQTLRYECPGNDANLDGPVDATGAVLVNQEEANALELEGLPVAVKNILRMLKAYPATTYWLIACCSLAALVQGFDETAVNGGEYFTITIRPNGDDDAGRLGLVNAAPYLLSAIACL
ncbi:hypothetical protein QQS21_000911 [Conoideocrella luteorostrata]|uniref:Uncharacterized protein n=1 Tax=Conoideocrella luteorostrata TaxID=1105319 RepID=A0AAJ0D163_9HYPO|nr:hypothetical protein QQS21_000911 [Conoideocrella luteorostrata]